MIQDQRGTINSYHLKEHTEEAVCSLETMSCRDSLRNTRSQCGLGQADGPPRDSVSSDCKEGVTVLPRRIVRVT